MTCNKYTLMANPVYFPSSIVRYINIYKPLICYASIPQSELCKYNQRAFMLANHVMHITKKYPSAVRSGNKETKSKKKAYKERLLIFIMNRWLIYLNLQFITVHDPAEPAALTPLSPSFHHPILHVLSYIRIHQKCLVIPFNKRLHIWIRNICGWPASHVFLPSIHIYVHEYITYTYL